MSTTPHTYRCAVSTLVNARPWSGTQVMSWVNPISLPTYAFGQGIFEDLHTLLNGRGGGAEAMGLLLQAGWTASGAAGNIIIGMNAAGRFYIQSDTVDFAMAPGAGNAFLGFSVGGHPLNGGAAPFRLTAPDDFQIEPTFAGGFTIDPAGAPPAFPVGTARWWRDAVTAVRRRGSGDRDDLNPTGSLEGLAQTAAGTGSIRIGQAFSGHTIIAWRTGTVPGPPTFSSVTFADFLGFSGNETVQTSGLTDYLQASKLPMGCMALEEPLDEYDPDAEVFGEASLLTSGLYGSAENGIIHGATFQLTIPGPATGPETMHLHFIERMKRFLGPGARYTVYPCWGDPRRRLSPLAVTSSQPAEDLVYTSRDIGYRGRLRGSIPQGAATRASTEWDGWGRSWWKISLPMTFAPEV